MFEQSLSAMSCVECGAHETNSVLLYSIRNFGVPLCVYHQQWIRTVDTTPENVKLYLALKQQGVPAKLEKLDGYKTIDIAIPGCKVNIEVDGLQHNYNPNQALSELKRNYISFLQGYLTLRIPNSFIESNLDNTVEYVVNFLNASHDKEWKRKRWY
jgi:very-short-patch-repair endonuclease